MCHTTCSKVNRVLCADIGSMVRRAEFPDLLLLCSTCHIISLVDIIIAAKKDFLIGGSA